MFSRKKPSDIRFSQDSIANHWKESKSSRIGVTLDQLLEDEITPDNIPTITVSNRHEFVYTSDNRRLWVFQKLETFGKCESIRVKYGYINPSKFTTNNQGTSILVRGDPGGSVWKMWGKDQNAAATNKHTECKTSRAQNRNEPGVFAPASAFAEALQFNEIVDICPGDIRYLQSRLITDGESLGKLLDTWLRVDSEHDLRIYEINGSYYSLEYEKLWVWKTLEKFGKSPKIRLQIKNNIFGESNARFSSDSLEFGINTSIGGLLWKNLSYLKNLQTTETVKSEVDNIYFTRKSISDTYENTSIAKVLADSYATMTIPRWPRVVKFNGKYYALDNEILWVIKEVKNLKSCTNLTVKVEVKIEMDRPLFQGFASDHIQKATFNQASSFSHTNEESFIFECIKKLSA